MWIGSWRGRGRTCYSVRPLTDPPSASHLASACRILPSSFSPGLGPENGLFQKTDYSCRKLTRKFFYIKEVSSFHQFS